MPNVDKYTHCAAQMTAVGVARAREDGERSNGWGGESQGTGINGGPERERERERGRTGTVVRLADPSSQQVLFGGCMLNTLAVSALRSSPL